MTKAFDPIFSGSWRVLRQGVRTTAVGWTCLAALACSDAHRRAPASASEVVVHVVSRDLTVKRLDTLLGNARIPVPVTSDNVLIVAKLWAGYQELGYAAAHGDTLADAAEMAIAPEIDRERVGLFMATLRRSTAPDTIPTERQYTTGAFGLLAIRHILFSYPPASTPIQRDSVLRAARVAIRSVTAANFLDAARRYSSDTSGPLRSGTIGIVSRSAMAPALAAAVVTLQPGAAAKMVGTPLGIDLVQRASWSDAKVVYSRAYARAALAAADSATVASVVADANLKVNHDAFPALRRALTDPLTYASDSTVVATFDGDGKTTLAQFLRWFNVMPAQQRAQGIETMPKSSDSLVALFARNMAALTVLLREADSAKVVEDPAHRAAMRDRFRASVVDSWKRVGVVADPKRTVADREAAAAAVVDQMIDGFMTGNGQLPPIPLSIAQALAAKYPTVINDDAVSRVVQETAPIRARADSLRAANSRRPQR